MSGKKNNGKRYISPISMDLGAANTGVFFAHYKEDSELKEIQKDGKVYTIGKNDYTLLMKERTAKRHQKRGYDRRQMAKRLLKLIWEKELRLEWNDNVQQTLSFLLNRRGYTFLDGEYSSDILGNLPKDVFDILFNLPGLSDLCEQINEKESEREDSSIIDFELILQDWQQEGEEGFENIRKINSAIKDKTDEIKKELVVVSRIRKLREYCQTVIGGGEVIEKAKDKVKMSEISNWIFEEWSRDMGRDKFPGIDQYIKNNRVNFVEYLNSQSQETLERIKESIPSSYAEKEARLKRDDYNFSPENFDLEKVEQPKGKDAFYSDDEKTVPNKTAHLRHFAFAIYKICHEDESGGRHRTQYFEEVESVLKKTKHSDKEDKYLKIFCENLTKGKFKGLDADGLIHLIGHVSNLELKPLRKYFNCKEYLEDKDGDRWDPSRLGKIVDRWMMQEWRVDVTKDKKKDKGQAGDYAELERRWKCWRETKGCEKVIRFWLENPPIYTIPPYQDNNNRRPPKCQSFILNVCCLDKKYPNWKDWAQELQGIPCVKAHLENYEDRLRSLESGKEKYYFESGKESDEKELLARVLQFILDRARDADPLNLNKIYSRAKKCKQNRRDGSENSGDNDAFKKSISNESKLPDKMKEIPRDIGSGRFSEESFLHFVCKYYKLRQRAKDGRIFVHPKYKKTKFRGYENTGHFEDDNSLLTYCNRKPRLKQYQMLSDMAALLMISKRKLVEKANIKNEKDPADEIENFLRGIKKGYFQTRCDKATKFQKDMRGELKVNIGSVYGRLHYYKEECQKTDSSLTKKDIANALKDSRVKDAKELYNFCEDAKESWNILMDQLHDDNQQIREKIKNDLTQNHAVAVYLLAQLNNIVFKERSGNAKTCLICSTDNAERMEAQSLPSDNGYEFSAKCQRLPAIETRMFDGGIKRLARIVTGAIAQDKWKIIKPCLERKEKICIPIITELNRFEFEPSLEAIKEKERKRKLPGKEEEGKLYDLFDEKKNRIKKAGGHICPYTGMSVGDKGELDHIIPRKSRWGTLNDEANLIWASQKGNQHKTNNPIYLSDLAGEYKRYIFGTDDDEKIKEYIYKEIGGGDSIGKYGNFLNLEPNEQKAFRHALFLQDDDPLRDKVIRAIDNRNRAFVNGTQRYFAEVLANALYKKAKKEGLESGLSFDYFGVRTGYSFGEVQYERNQLNLPEKKKGQKQEAYSHLIDAQVAFMCALSEHIKEGSFRVKNDMISPVQWVDGEGEIHSVYDAIRVSEESFNHIEINRRKSQYGTRSNRSFTLPNPFAMSFLPVWFGREKDKVVCRRGFSWKNSEKISNGEKFGRMFQNFLPFVACKKVSGMTVGDGNKLEDIYGRLRKIFKGREVFYITWKKSKIMEHLIRTQSNKQILKRGEWIWDDLIKMFINILSYQTKREEVTEENLGNRKDFHVTKNIVLPSKKEWEELATDWERKKHSSRNFMDFLGKHKIFSVESNRLPHEKKSHSFSLPVVDKGGHFVIRRKSWNGADIFQVLPDSDSRKDSNKFSRSVLSSADGSLKEAINRPFNSSKQFKIKPPAAKNFLFGNHYNVDPNRWYKISLDKSLEDMGVESLSYRIDNPTRPKTRITLKRDNNVDTNILAENPLTKFRDDNRESIEKDTSDGKRMLEYTADKYSAKIKDKIVETLRKEKTNKR